MPIPHAPLPPEYRQRLVELVGARQSPAELEAVRRLRRESKPVQVHALKKRRHVGRPGAGTRAWRCARSAAHHAR